MKTATEWCALILSLSVGALSAQAEQTKPKSQSMDLRVGKVTDLFSAEQLRLAMRLDDSTPSGIAEVDPQELDTVVVEGASERPDIASPTRVPSGLGAVLWSIAHPLQAWRIFVPSPSE